MRHVLLFVLFAAARLAGEEGLTQTSDYPLAQLTSRTTCTLSAGTTCKGLSCPTCTVDSTQQVAWAGLDFPANKKTCIVNRPVVPDNVDITSSRPLAIRVTFTRIGGATGTSSGGVCTGECGKLTARIVGTLDETPLGAPPPASAPLYVSDNLPGGGPSASGKKITATIRDINLTTAAVYRRNEAVVEICRDPARPDDTQEGSLRLVTLFYVWPTQPHPSAGPVSTQAVEERMMSEVGR